MKKFIARSFFCGWRDAHCLAQRLVHSGHREQVLQQPGNAFRGSPRRLIASPDFALLNVPPRRADCVLLIALSTLYSLSRPPGDFLFQFS